MIFQPKEELTLKSSLSIFNQLFFKLIIKTHKQLKKMFLPPVNNKKYIKLP